MCRKAWSSSKEEEPTFFTRRMDAPAAMHQMFIDNTRVIGYPEDLIANPDLDGFDTIIDFLHDKGFASGRIGLEAKSISVQAVEKFKSRMPKGMIVDFANGVHWIRGIKSDLEIAVMREAAANADAGMTRAKDVIRPGIREADARRRDHRGTGARRRWKAKH